MHSHYHFRFGQRCSVTQELWPPLPASPHTYPTVVAFFLHSFLPPFSLLSAYLFMKGSDREYYFAWIVFVHTHNSITLGVVMRQCAGWLLRNLRDGFLTEYVVHTHTYVYVISFLCFTSVSLFLRPVAILWRKLTFLLSEGKYDVSN